MSEADFCYDIGQELADRETFYQEHRCKPSRPDLSARICNQRAEISRLHEKNKQLLKDHQRVLEDVKKLLRTPSITRSEIIKFIDDYML